MQQLLPLIVARFRMIYHLTKSYRLRPPWRQTPSGLFCGGRAVLVWRPCRAWILALLLLLPLLAGQRWVVARLHLVHHTNSFRLRPPWRQTPIRILTCGRRAVYRHRRAWILAPLLLLLLLLVVVLWMRLDPFVRFVNGRRRLQVQVKRQQTHA